MQKLISFIIPVYNVEDYLRYCIDSIISQGISDYEIILVDDGSTDKSGEICEEYSRMDSRIKVEHTSNMGQSSARNTGIQLATGKYIAFIDSDDYYVKDSLEKFERHILENPNVDIVVGKVKTFFQDTGLTKPKCNYKNLLEIEGVSGEAAIRNLINTGQFLQSVYSYFVKREILVKNNIHFNVKHKAYEDFDFTLKVFLAAKEVRVIDEYFLMYRKNRVGQITYKGNLKRDLSAFEVTFYWLEKITDLKISEETKMTLIEYLSNNYFSSLGNQYFYSKAEKKVRYNALKSGSQYIRYVTSKKLIIGKYVYKLFGFRMCVHYLTLIKYIYRAKGKFNSLKI